MTPLNTIIRGKVGCKPPIEKRFWTKVNKTEACWIWTGYLDRDGYGQIRHLGKSTGTHRVAWILTNGEIPEGLVIDHLCRNRKCVNPTHMRIVTPKVNTMCGFGVGVIQKTKTLCLRGHEFDFVNMDGSRRCKACDRINRATRRDRDKEKKNS